MDRLLEFSMNHPELVGPFFILLIGFFLLESRRGGKTVSPAQLTSLVNNEEGLVLDVRDAKEYREGHITGARNIPFSKLKESLTELTQYKEKPVVLVCKMGQHSGAAGKILNTDGFKNVLRLKGGISTWSAEGLPLVKGKAK